MSKRLLLGTTNPEKLAIFRNILAPLDIELLSLRDLNITIAVEEDGNSTEANARKKAQVYCAASGLPALAMDAGLFIEGFPAAKQPGVWVRRIHGLGRDVSDQEALEHYVRELEKIGGESRCTWDVTLALAIPPDQVFCQTFADERLITARPSRVRRPGAPLASLTIDPATGRYYSELDHNDRPNTAGYVAFVKQYLDMLTEPK
jgi:inosine/xanthosine triphosphate pyrophosphatase family protein